MSAVRLDGASLTLAELRRIAAGDPVELAPGWEQPVERSRALVEEAVAAAGRTHGEDGAPLEQELVYGATTGFGSLKDQHVCEPERALKMQRHLLLSHACGVGEALPPATVRLVLALRLNAFLRGRSGVRCELVRLLHGLLEARISPRIPEQGSLGASGDLAPLSHLGLVLIGEGEARRGDDPGADWRPAREVLAECGLEPLALSYKEGLAITNGTSFTAAIAVQGWWLAHDLMRHADLTGALSLEACLGRSRAFDPKIHAERGQLGQIRSAANIMALCEGSTLLDRTDELQDSYCLRCMPQVHGASQDALEHTGRVLAREINAATDNPLFFVEPEDGEPIDVLAGRCEGRLHAYSGGNFHAQPLALATDYLKMAVAEIGSIAERRIQKLLDRHHNAGLPGFLIASEPGLNSGFMVAQYTAAALVSENKILCHPASVDSIPTSANIEDHVSMAPVAARNLVKVASNVEKILAIEVLCAAQGLAYRTGSIAAEGLAPAPTRGVPGRGVAVALARLRDVVHGGVAALTEDRYLIPDLERTCSLLGKGDLLRAIEAEAGVALAVLPSDPCFGPAPA